MTCTREKCNHRMIVADCETTQLALQPLVGSNDLRHDCKMALELRGFRKDHKTRSSALHHHRGKHGWTWQAGQLPHLLSRGVRRLQLSIHLQSMQ